MKMFLLMLLMGFVQQSLSTFNIRNISSGRVRAAAITSFFITVTWGAAVVIIASNTAGSVLNLIFYGLGASAGVTCSILVDKYYIHPKKKKDDCE